MTKSLQDLLNHKPPMVAASAPPTFIPNSGIPTVRSFDKRTEETIQKPVVARNG